MRGWLRTTGSSGKFEPAVVSLNYDIIADARMEIEQARLLCLKAAWMMDQGDARAAAPWISQIKVVAPRVALKVVDEAVQMFGAQGISQDVPLAAMWTHLRTLRLADGPDVDRSHSPSEHERRGCFPRECLPLLATRLSLLRSAAFRPCFTAGLAFS